MKTTPNQLDIFETPYKEYRCSVRIRDDFGMPGWPHHPSAGKKCVVTGPAKLHDGRVLSFALAIRIKGETMDRIMHKNDLKFLN